MNVFHSRNGNISRIICLSKYACTGGNIFNFFFTDEAFHYPPKLEIIVLDGLLSNCDPWTPVGPIRLAEICHIPLFFPKLCILYYFVYFGCAELLFPRWVFPSCRE